MDTNDILKQIKNFTDNNSKSESKNKTLTSLDFTPNNGKFIGAARENAKRAYSVDEDLANKYNKTMIVDAMSSMGAIPIDVKKLNIDFLISSANKCIQGVPGFGFIICNKESLIK